MYLKSLEIVGFKSFAERTKLDFEPGLTAIVGPNGCGKSNVSDAIRWVLGEQSAKALRGGKMQDVIFNGTDDKKPLAMAEVSLTLSDCEATLGTDFHEVTVTRRVFRSGEGQYFMNKAPCRLKDLQRLFMDTGIGTNSYSVMEQGKIDLILSARPDDRRAVFEEASGITKYKADKKDAIRKLEHTEANLLRLSDIIREVKRQIISLQRQVGKARRYKTLQEKLRAMDLYLGRDKLETFKQQIQVTENKLASLKEQDEALRADVDKADEEATAIRQNLAMMDQQIEDAMERAVSVKNELQRAHELIQVNRDRIRELEELSMRDERETEDARIHLESHKTNLAELETQLLEAQQKRDTAEAELSEFASRYTSHEEQTENTRATLHNLRTESVDIESRIAKLQNDLYDLEAQERTSVIRRERLAAEKAETQRAAENCEIQLEEKNTSAEELKNRMEAHRQQVNDLLNEKKDRQQSIADLKQRIAELSTQIAARQAKIDLLQRNRAEAEGFPGGARLLLDESNALPVSRDVLHGPLAEAITAEKGYEIALQSVLRAWLDSIIVKDKESAVKLLNEVKSRSEGSVRLLIASHTANTHNTPLPEGSDQLLNHVSVSDQAKELSQSLLGHVVVINDLDELPGQLAADITYVTKSGIVIRDNALCEYWMAQENEANPLARQHLLNEWQQEIDQLQGEQDTLSSRLENLIAGDQNDEEQLEAAQSLLEDCKHNLALCEGECQIVAQQLKKAREREETVEWELNVLEEQTDTGSNKRDTITSEMEELKTRQEHNRNSVAEQTEQLRTLEKHGAALSAEVTEKRVNFAEQRQHAEHLLSRKEPLMARIHELDALIRDRAEGVDSYKRRMEELQASIETNENRIEPLEAESAHCNEALEQAKQLREEKTKQLGVFEKELHEKRYALDEFSNRKSGLEVEAAEQRMRYQNLLERLTGEYSVDLDTIRKHPEPEWDDGSRPDNETIETMVAEIKTKLNSMGAVNLVAIEEHQELEERFAFLTQQQDDLVNAKQQLLDLIKKINTTTTEMFSKTFEQVNENFQGLFKQLFGGGTARLVLVDEENVLDSGIEIIARPPGKKPQTVSLLSGGERTMTAVALLFALYMVKPSPFCLLDELDAALDEANIGRFIEMLEGFLKDSQFIVITHSKKTIAAASILYGVTMEKHGISKIVSVKFSDHEKQPEGELLPAK